MGLQMSKGDNYISTRCVTESFIQATDVDVMVQGVTKEQRTLPTEEEKTSLTSAKERTEEHHETLHEEKEDEVQVASEVPPSNTSLGFFGGYMKWATDYMEMLREEKRKLVEDSVKRNEKIKQKGKEVEEKKPKADIIEVVRSDPSDLVHRARVMTTLEYSNKVFKNVTYYR